MAQAGKALKLENAQNPLPAVDRQQDDKRALDPPKPKVSAPQTKYCCGQTANTGICINHQLQTLISDPANRSYRQMQATLTRMRHLVELTCGEVRNGCIVNGTQCDDLNVDLEACFTGLGRRFIVLLVDNINAVCLLRLEGNLLIYFPGPVFARPNFTICVTLEDLFQEVKELIRSGERKEDVNLSYQLISIYIVPMYSVSNLMCY